MCLQNYRKNINYLDGGESERKNGEKIPAAAFI